MAPDTNPYGALKTLFTMISQASEIAGNNVNIAFGEENKIAQEFGTPYVCMVPIGGRYKKDEPAYALDADPSIDMQWPLQETIELWCWNANAGGVGIDNADATEDLRAFVLQALWDQRGLGLYFEPISERWALMQDQETRAGRALVITVEVDITVAYVAPVNATVTEITLDPITLESA